MSITDIFRRERPGTQVSVQTARTSGGFESPLDSFSLRAPETALYDRLRESVPIIDAALDKIVRLTVDFRPVAAEREAQPLLDAFAAGVPVGAFDCGLGLFAARYLQSLLTYGAAVGEAVLTGDRRGVYGLYLPPLDNIRLTRGDNPLRPVLCAGGWGDWRPLASPELVWYSALDPKPGEYTGRSLLAGLPFISGILMKIYESMGNNFARLGDLRYAVTYKPAGAADRAAAQQIAEGMAKQWKDCMDAAARGEVRDFVAVGDVEVKVIGADSGFIDTDVPVRQLLEQIVAKLGLPPFLLGLSWSTTERMSRQQADILTTELESYRRLLTSVLSGICGLFLRMRGFRPDTQIEWGCISLQDETELASARLNNARAAQIENSGVKD